MEKLIKMVVSLFDGQFSQKNMVQTIIWKLNRMVESSEKTLDKVAAEIVALEAEIGDGERTTALESKEDFLERVGDQIAEIEALIPAAKKEYTAQFNEVYTEKAKTSKPRSAAVKALLDKKRAEAA